MPICVLKRGDSTCVSSRENDARFLHQNEVKFARQRNKMAANLDLFDPHAFAQAAQRKHKIRLALSHCRPR